MSTETENKTADISIEEFADIYDGQEENKNEPVRKGILDDLEETTSIEDVVNKDIEKDKNEPDIESILEGPEVEQKEHKQSTIEKAMRKMINDGRMPIFDDGKSIDDYTEDDWEQLWEATMNETSNNVTQMAFKEDFDNLSPEAQAIIRYERDGGKDIKGVLMALANAKESIDLDISTVEGQKDIVYEYYSRKRLFKNQESLEKEIERLEENGDLEEKAKEFKPMLEEIQIEEVNRQLAKQQQQKKIIETQLKNYNASIYRTLDKDNINGVHITNKTKNMIFNGLTTNSYQTASGKRTNLLYHLLEKNQYIKPNHDLIAEITWHLADPEGYKKAVVDSIRKEVTTETANKLKNEQQGRNTGNGEYNNQRRIVKRPLRNIFER